MPEQFDHQRAALVERLATIPIEALEQSWGTKYRWYYVAGAVDYLRNGANVILQNYDAYRDDRNSFREVIAVSAEHAIKNFTPPSWVEPIRVPVGYVSEELCAEIADAVTTALFD